MPTETPRSVELASPAARLRPWLQTEAAVAQRILLVGLAALLVIWMFRQVEVVAVAAFLGFAQTALLWPVVKRLRRFLPGGLAAILVVTVYAAAIVSLIWFIIVEMSRSWSGLVDAVLSALESTNNWLLDLGLSLTPETVQNLGAQARGMLSQVFNGVGSFAITGINAASALVTVIVVATFATLFCLASGDDFWRTILGALHPTRRERVDRAMREGFRTARWWMIASTATGLADGLFIGLGLWFLGVPFVVPIMVLTFILGFIPMIGATTAGAIAVGVALFSGGIKTAIWALIVVLAVQQIEGNVLSPLLLSRAMSFHPVVTLLVATGGGMALGFSGLFLAVPVAGVLVAMRRGWFASTETDDDTAAEADTAHDVPDPSDASKQPDRTDGPGHSGAAATEPSS